MLVSAIPRRRRVRVLRCSASCLDEGRAGENVGVLLKRGTKREDVENVVRYLGASRARINPHTKFEAEVYMSVQRRRRSTYPVLSMVIVRSFILEQRM